MRMRLGCRLSYAFQQPTPMIALLNVHFSRFGELDRPDYLTTTPSVPIDSYRDGFGNWCTRLVAPAGSFVLSTDGVFRDDGNADPQIPDATQHAVEDLPHETLSCLLGSRYCDTERLTETAWKLFEDTPPGWSRVQAICDFVHGHVDVRLRTRPRRPGPRPRPTPKAAASAATTRISPSPSAAA